MSTVSVKRKELELLDEKRDSQLRMKARLKRGMPKERARTELHLLDIKREYRRQIRVQRQRVRIDACPPRCEHLGAHRHCTVDNCIYIAAQEKTVIEQALRDVGLPKEVKNKRIMRIPRGAKRLLYDTGRGLYDEIVGDPQIWCYPKFVEKKWLVSHRVTIYGVRAGKARILAIVEVYCNGWENSHVKCHLHRKRLKKRNGRFIWNYECPACLIDEAAKVAAYDWFTGIKLRDCGVNFVFLPFEKYLFEVQSLRSGHSRSLGKLWL